jgi:hypothetical protein
MVEVTRTVIHLGNFADGIPDIDPNGTGDAENAAALVGRVFTPATMSIQTVTYSDGSSDGRVNFDGAVGPGGEFLRYDLGSGLVSEQVDQGVMYRVNILLANGTTLTPSAFIFQTPSGETFFTEFTTSLDNLDIVSITPTAVENSFFSRMNTNASVDNTTVCFAQDTEILTLYGLRSVQDLLPDDAVMTTDGVARRVVAIYRTPADPSGSLASVRFDTGSLGPGTPRKPLIVTANHRMLCASRLVARMFGLPEVLVPAKRFVGLPGITHVPASAQAEFHHLELDTHSVICANGAMTESCIIGPVALRALPKTLRQEWSFRDQPALRYPVPKGHKQRQFVQRLVRNGLPVIDGPSLQQYDAQLRSGIAVHPRLRLAKGNRVRFSMIDAGVANRRHSDSPNAALWPSSHRP